MANKLPAPPLKASGGALSNCNSQTYHKGKETVEPEEQNVRVALFQSDANYESPAERLDLLARTADRLKGEKLDLLVCPELFSSGYDIGSEVLGRAEPLEGKFASGVKDIASASKLAIIYGYPEYTDKGIFNSAACIGANGGVIANHRKCLLPPNFERQLFAKGNSMTVFDLNSVRYAILICYESEFPEAFRRVVRQGAQVVIVPTATAERWSVVPDCIAPTRAFENGVFVVYANLCGADAGSTYAGKSCIVDPLGNDLARAGKQEEVLVAVLKIASLNAARNRLPYHLDSTGIPGLSDISAA